MRHYPHPPCMMACGSWASPCGCSWDSRAGLVGGAQRQHMRPAGLRSSVCARAVRMPRLLCSGSPQPLPQDRQATAPARGVCGRGDAGLGQLPQSLLVPSCLREGGCAPGCTALARLLGWHVGCSPATCPKPGNEGAWVAEGRVWMDQTLPASHSGMQAAPTFRLWGLC